MSLPSRIKYSEMRYFTILCDGQATQCYFLFLMEIVCTRALYLSEAHGVSLNNKNIQRYRLQPFLLTHF